MRGYSLIEVMVTLGIGAVLIAIAVPMWNANRMNVLTARRMVLANLRLARTNAITKFVHYQVSFPNTGHVVALSRMVESPAGSGTWVADTTKVQTSALPADTQVSTAAVIVQFNTRGMVANATTMTGISLTDSFGNTKSLQVWPSGQTNEM
jgi:prepilin-type N-terminal cleavage/methylation domain-containing protein